MKGGAEPQPMSAADEAEAERRRILLRARRRCAQAAEERAAAAVQQRNMMEEGGAQPQPRAQLEPQPMEQLEPQPMEQYEDEQRKEQERNLHADAAEHRLREHEDGDSEEEGVPVSDWAYHNKRRKDRIEKMAQNGEISKWYDDPSLRPGYVLPMVLGQQQRSIGPSDIRSIRETRLRQVHRETHMRCSVCDELGLAQAKLLLGKVVEVFYIPAEIAVNVVGYMTEVGVMQEFTDISKVDVGALAAKTQTHAGVATPQNRLYYVTGLPMPVFRQLRRIYVNENPQGSVVPPGYEASFKGVTDRWLEGHQDSPGSVTQWTDNWDCVTHQAFERQVADRCNTLTFITTTDGDVYGGFSPYAFATDSGQRDRRGRRNHGYPRRRGEGAPSVHPFIVAQRDDAREWQLVQIDVGTEADSYAGEEYGATNEWISHEAVQWGRGINFGGGELQVSADQKFGCIRLGHGTANTDPPTFDMQTGTPGDPPRDIPPKVFAVKSIFIYQIVDMPVAEFEPLYNWMLSQWPPRGPPSGERT
jgi:hypothetical protein